VGVLTNLFGDRTSEKFGDSWVNTYYGRYEGALKRHPERPPCYNLLEMWEGHFALKKEVNAHRLQPTVVKHMMALHGCLPHPSGGAALALYMLFCEHPQVCALHSKYEKRYGDLMTEVMVLEQAKNWDALNTLFNLVNAGAAAEPVFPIYDPRVDALKKRWGISEE